MMTDEQMEAASYTSDEPDIEALCKQYEAATNDLGEYYWQSQRNYEARRNLWAGKSNDLRKNAEDAFPWKGASDQEVHVVGQRLDDLVALCMTGLNRSHVKALAIKMESMPRAATVSAFAKWMASSYIRDFDVHHEKAVNYGLEKGLMISYVGWEKVERTFKQDMDLEQIREVNPDIALMIEDGEDDDLLADMLRQQWPKLKPAKAKKSIRQLREKGFAELYVSRVSLMDSRPIVRACAPDGEVFYPGYCFDPNRSPYVFWRQTMTVQEIEEKVTTEGWDRKWADHMIENYRGVGVNNFEYNNQWRDRTLSGFAGDLTSDQDLILVVYAYQKQIDPDDGSEGIYKTVFNPYYTGADRDIQAYASKELMNGYSTYPFVVTRMSADSDRMYDQQALPEKLRGAQWAVKVERDSRIDRNSLATMPPLTGPAGRQPQSVAPGRYVPRRRADDYSYLQTPPLNMGSNEVEATIQKMADRIAGLDPENPLTPIRQQFIVNKTLDHARRVLLMAYTCFQRFGPDEVFFNVTGVPDPVTMENVEDDEFDLQITFDTLSTDPDTMEARFKAMASLMQMDPAGRIDPAKMIEFAAFSIDPAFASYVIQPAEENQAKLMNDIADDFAKLFGGVEIGARPNGAQMAMQMGQAWMQQPDVAQRLQGDEAFAARVEKYFGQVQFQLQQAQNAQIGRIGTAPATFQAATQAPQ